MLFELIAGLGAPAPQQEGAPARQEVVVTASGFAEDPLEAPWSTSQRSREEMRAALGALPEALRALPSVMVQKTAYGQASPFLRGFTGFRSLMLVDGVRLNHSAFRDGPNQYWSTVDFLTVERLEVVRGTSSVLYGSDAVGGTVNAVARRAPLGTEDGGFGAGGALFGRYASAEDSWIGRLESHFHHSDDWGLLAGYSGKDFNDLQAGRDTGLLPATGYQERDGDLRFDHYLDSGVNLTLAAQTVRQIDVPRTHSTIFAVPYAGTTAGSELRRELDQVRDLAYARAAWSEAGGTWDAAEITLSVQRHDEEQDRLRSGRRRDLQGFEVVDYGLLARFESEGWGRWSWGGEAHQEQVDSFRNNYVGGVSTGTSVQGPIGDDSEYASLAAYVQNEQRFADWSLIPGLRYTRVSFAAERVANPGPGPAVLKLEDDWNSLVGSLRGVYWLGSASNLYAGLSQGFRAPNLSDVSAFETTSVAELPTRGLDPEHYLQAEVGFKAEEGAWGWQAAVYRTWIQDMIVRSPTGATLGGTPVVRKDNLGDGWIHGVELETQWRWHPDWRSGLAFSWMDGEADQLQEPQAVVVREPVDRLMPLQALLTTRWQPKERPYWIEGWAWVMDDQDQLSLRDAVDTSRIPPGGSPGFTVFGLGVGWEVEKDVRLHVAVENLADKDYRVHGSGVNGPGRNLVLALELRF